MLAQAKKGRKGAGKNKKSVDDPKQKKSKPGKASQPQKIANSVKLEEYSSPSIFNRAYIPNPAILKGSVDSANTFSLVSYNILAECHRIKIDYSYTPPKFLKQDYRHRLLMKELKYLNGDVVCLQEVNPAYFEQTLLPEMQKLGYEGLMMKRTKEDMDEGEATFYKTDVVNLEASEGVSLTAVAHKKIETYEKSPVVIAAGKAYTDRPDVVLITRLYCKAAKKSVTVGNVHIVYDDFKSPDVQTFQAACAIDEVLRVAGSEKAPHILCGDFNGEPQSPVKRLVDEQEYSVGELQRVEGLNMERGHGPHSLWCQFPNLPVHVSSSLRSAYKAVTGQEPEVTCCTDQTWTLDYVFFGSNSLLATGVLKVVDKNVVEATGGLPSKDFPSDHLSLKAVLAFT